MNKDNKEYKYKSSKIKANKKYRLKCKERMIFLASFFDKVIDILKDNNLTAEQKISNIKNLFL